MYVRVKRSKTTIFLHVEPTDTVLEIKQKLQELVQQVLHDMKLTFWHANSSDVCSNTGS